MRYIRWAFLAILGVALVTLALANDTMVTLRLLPPELAGFLGFSWAVSLPLFVVIFLGIIAGIIIGFVWEWLREYRLRAEAARDRRERDRLAQEVRKLRGDPDKSDDILALIE